MSTLLRKLRCAVGLHAWRYTPAVYADARCEMLSLPTRAATRECACCDAAQYEDRHCLGLNPPEYYATWHKLERPRHA